MAGKKKHRFHDGRSGSAIRVHVILMASENHIERVTADGVVQIAMKNQVLDEGLNRDLLSFLSWVLGVKISDLEVIGGENGMDKLITVIGINPDQMQVILNTALN
ncbi:MAG: hypothetical protein ROW48_14450 [Bellilinea sp.]|jgi:uncharacterized protein YggU (UPF0235/DUF167 family)